MSPGQEGNNEKKGGVSRRAPGEAGTEPSEARRRRRSGIDSHLRTKSHMSWTDRRTDAADLVYRSLATGRRCPCASPPFWVRCEAGGGAVASTLSGGRASTEGCQLRVRLVGRQYWVS